MLKRGRNLVVVAAAVIAAVLGSNATALADANANTDDKSVIVPTGWGLLTNATGSYVNSWLGSSRITDLEIHSVTSSGPKFTVVSVPNSGAYWVPWSSWAYNLTAQGVEDAVNNSHGRLIDLEPYTTSSGQLRFAIVLVPNTGATARAWWYFTSISYASLENFVGTDNPYKRLVHFKQYWDGSSYRYVAIMVANTGSDAKSWWWGANTTMPQQECGTGTRVFHVGARETNNYDTIWVQNTLPAGKSWCYYKGLTSTQQVLDIADYQNMRVIDIDTYTMTYTNERRYDVVMIANS